VLLVVVLHVHLAPLALPLEMRGARLAFFFHGIEVWRPLRARERHVIDRASVLMANSQWTVQHFKEANPAYASANIRVCHLGVSPAATADPAPREGYALIVGRLASSERYKGHDALIDVWPLVRQAVPGAELLIVGDGDDRARLEARVASMELGTAIHFAGRVSNSVLEGLYRGAAFFVMPSVGEGFGLAYLEAMRAGKACLAGPGAAAEIVEDGVTGLIVDPGRRDALAAAIIQLFREPETRAAMGRAGAARVQAEFETRHFASRVLGELSEALVHA
jgi:phosphatidylinositol alpha-1,6-mannosyltransferase